nr:hypothetical protein [Tanacetum cinerariifolium]
MGYFEFYGLETSAAIGDTRPAAGSFSMVDVRRLSAHVIKLRDMPEGVLVLSGLSRVWKYSVCDLVLWGADGNGNQGGSFTAPAIEGLGMRDSQGKGIMVDNATTSSAGAGRPRPSSGFVPSFRDVSGDAIHTDFFPFSVGPYYATLWRSFKARFCLKLI